MRNLLGSNEIKVYIKLINLTFYIFSNSFYFESSSNNFILPRLSSPSSLLPGEAIYYKALKKITKKVNTEIKYKFV